DKLGFILLSKKQGTTIQLYKADQPRNGDKLKGEAGFHLIQDEQQKPEIHENYLTVTPSTAGAHGRSMISQLHRMSVKL
ncbi:hypothetical protein AQUCO_05400088v1, partial [Aquilegia coerulea]